ncbi:MAG: FtsX-like permease family protein [Desulfobacteraceae bacterium]|nr:FtsX-like permease family protein [Desulfobacteraceae bacterium]
MGTKIKYYHIVCTAIKNLLINKGKFFMLAIPLTIIIAIVSAFSFFIEGVRRDALLAADYYPDILIQQQVGGRTESLFFDRYDDVLKDINAIKSYYPRSWGYINHTDSKNRIKSFVVMGLDPEYISSGLFIDVAIEQGRSLREHDYNKAIAGKALAAAFDCTTGDTIEVTSPGLRKPVLIEVVGIFDTAVQIYSADLLLVDRQTANTILGFIDDNESSDIMVYLSNPAMAGMVASNLLKKIDGANPVTKSAMQSLTEQSFGQKSGFFHLLWFILLVNVMIIAWSLTSHISFSLRKEIGILKAIGWDTGDIMILKSFETLTIGFFSIIAGLIGGIAYMFSGAPGIKQMIIGWTDIYPEFPIPLYVNASTVFLIIILGIIPLLAGTLFPIWRIGAIDPDKAIRQ